MTAFPGAEASFTGFTASHTLAADSHASQHNLEQSEITATQHKIGTGASTPTSGMLLRGNGAGTSAWAQVGLTTDVTGVLPLANGGTGGSSASATAANLATEVGKLLFPIGCVYTETTGVNPGTSLGFGTWTAFGGGRVLVGNGTSDAVYAAGATGGESNHTLTTTEMPSHTHTLGPIAANSTAGGNANFFAGNNSGTFTPTSNSTGSDGSHNNLQPYIVAYFWKRTA